MYYYDAKISLENVNKQSYRKATVLCTSFIYANYVSQAAVA